MKNQNPVPDWALRLLTIGLFLASSPLLSAGEVFHTRQDSLGSIIEDPKDGKLERRYSNGRLSIRSFVKDGKLEGLTEQWLEDGTLITRQKFHQGVLVDTMTSWDLNGRLSEITVFEDGNPIWTENFRGDGSRYFLSYRLRDTTYKTIRWNGKGEVTEEKLETQPVLRFQMQP
jgi:hypothetical protein